VYGSFTDSIDGTISLEKDYLYVFTHFIVAYSISQYTMPPKEKLQSTSKCRVKIER
jgi:hypothetical protein